MAKNGKNILKVLQNAKHAYIIHIVKNLQRII